jgi:hypothetical protein
MPEPVPVMMVEAIRAVEDVLVRLAETTDRRRLYPRHRQAWALSARRLTIADAVDEMWTMLELGDLRLEADGEQLRVAPFEGAQIERQKLARRLRPLIEARWRVIQATTEERPAAEPGRPQPAFAPIGHGQTEEGRSPSHQSPAEALKN